MKILVTGASGFLGRHLLPRLAEAGHEVRALSRDPLADLAAPVAQGDILDPDALAAAVEGCDAVIHAAGKVSHDPADAAELWALHVKGTENVLDAAKAAGARRVVYLSTSGTAAVGTSDKARSESSPPPLHLVRAWPYYRSKLFAEQAALSRSAPGFEVVSLNPSLLLGPGDDRNGASTRSVRLFLDERVPAAPPGGISFVDVRDVAFAAAIALRQGQPGQRYLLSGGNMSFAEYYRKLARISGRPAPRVGLPEVTRKVLGWLPDLKKINSELTREELELACHWWTVDDARAREELSWTPRDPLRTLEDTVHDLLAREGESFAPWV